MSKKRISKKLKNKNRPIINLVEGTRRFVLGTQSDENNATSWKDTLILIVLLIIAFFLYSLFKK